MPNTREEWNRKVEKAVETLGEAAAMGMMPAEQIIQMVQSKAQEFEGNVPKMQGEAARPPAGAPPMPPAGPMGDRPGAPPPGMDFERMPPDQFGDMKEDVLRGRLGGGSPGMPRPR